MKRRLVLDAAAFDLFASRQGEQLRGLMRVTAEMGGGTYCSAVTLAEVCRGSARTRQVEATLACKNGGPRIHVIPTDTRFGKLVGAILHRSRSGSERLGDAHVVAVYAAADSAIVVTEDPDDIAGLATAVPGTRIMVRHPAKLN